MTENSFFGSTGNGYRGKKIEDTDRVVHYNDPDRFGRGKISRKGREPGATLVGPPETDEPISRSEWFVVCIFCRRKLSRCSSLSIPIIWDQTDNMMALDSRDENGKKKFPA